MREKNLSMYRLSKNSGIPYTTVNDIFSGKTSLEKCSAETVYRLARALDVTMEELLEPYMQKFCSFELFKGNVCHRLKESGDIDFLIDTLESGEIRTYYRLKRYRESLYLLGMVDYISRINDVPQCSEYEDLRKCRLAEPVYPSDVLIACAAAGNDDAREEARRKAIPEFMRFNIVECEVRDVI